MSFNGKEHSPEMRKKIAESRRGRKGPVDADLLQSDVASLLEQVPDGRARARLQHKFLIIERTLTTSRSLDKIIRAEKVKREALKELHLAAVPRPDASQAIDPNVAKFLESLKASHCDQRPMDSADRVMVPHVPAAESPKPSSAEPPQVRKIPQPEPKTAEPPTEYGLACPYCGIEWPFHHDEHCKKSRAAKQ